MTTATNAFASALVFNWRANSATAGLVPLLRFYLGLAKPEEITVTLNGEHRPAYRCPNLLYGEGARWVTWRSRDFGQIDENKEYPVYVQSHAIHRLHERLSSGDYAYMATDIMRFSVSKPQITNHAGKQLLVCRLDDFRLGYFTFERLPDKVVITTFLFLTMQGTPEADLLYDRLRVRRNDIEYLTLDRLSTFVETDLNQDPHLREVFSQCGCGHLLSIAVENPLQQLADQTRKYLRLSR